MDELYFEIGYIDDNYFTYVANSNTIMSADFNQSSAGGIIIDSYVSLNANFTQDTTLNEIFGLQLFAYSDSLLETNLGLIADINSSLTSVFDIATDGIRIATSDAEFAIDTTVVADLQYVKTTDAAFSAAFALGITFEIINTNVYALTANFTQISTPIITTNSVANLQCNFTQVTDVISAKIADANLQSSFTQVTNGYAGKLSGRPHLCYTNISNAYISNTTYKLGTGSLRIGASFGNPAIKFDIPVDSTHNINAGDDFYISSWIKTTETYNLNASGQREYIIGKNFSFGFIKQVGVERTVAQVKINTGTTTYLTCDINLDKSMIYNWIHYELFRINGVITFRFTNDYGTQDISLTYNGQLFDTSTSGFCRSSNYSEIFFDEFFLAIGTGYVHNYKANGEINDGSLETTRWLYHFNDNIYTTPVYPNYLRIYEDDMTGIQAASANITATFTEITTPAVITSNLVDLQANFTQTANITDIKQISLVAFSSISMTTDITVIKPLSAVIASNFDYSISTAVQYSLLSNQSATFTQVSNLYVLVKSSAYLDARFNLTATGSFFVFDKELTFIIPYENREFIILYEDRDHIIQGK